MVIVGSQAGPAVSGGLWVQRLVVGEQGSVRLAGGDTLSEQASLTANQLATLEGTIEVSGQARMVGPLTTTDTASIHLADAASDLDLQSEILRFNGGTVSGGGVLRMTGFAVVGANTTTIGSGSFDWDGNLGTSQTNIGASGTLIINSPVIDVFDTGPIEITQPGAEAGPRGAVVDGFDGTLHMLGGRLVVNTEGPWRMQGEMLVTGGSRLEGQQMIIEDGGIMETDFLLPFFGPTLEAPIKLGGGGTIRADRESLTLAGPVTLAGGTLTGSRTISISGDLIVESNSEITATGQFNWGSGAASHRTTIRDGAELRLNADRFSNFPFVNPAYAGVVDVGEGGRLIVNVNDFTQWGVGGTLRMGAGSVVAGDKVSVSGRLEGSGSIQTDLINRGVVAPGNLTATRYEQQESGRLEIALAAGGSSRLSAPFGATLDGSVAIELLPGFLPATGSSFPFLTSSLFGSIAGTFDLLELVAPPGVLFDGQLNYATTAVSFEVTLAALAADFDGDDDVDGEDFLAWQAGFGITTGAVASDGDADRDGDVDGQDFLMWQLSLGSSGGRGTGQSPAAAHPVPEPAAAVLATILAGAMVRRNRPHRFCNPVPVWP